MTDNSTEELLSTESDTSFVILSNGSLPPSIVEEKISVGEIPSIMTNSASFINYKKSNGDELLKSSIFSNLNKFDNEAQDFINQLIQENFQLKETLSQNNLAIKSHLSNFFLRQQEMLQAQDSHKQKFSEMKELFLQLKSENYDLKKKLEYYMHDNLNGKQVADDYSSDAKKKSELSIQAIEKLLMEEKNKSKELEIEKENLSLKNLDLQASVNRLEKEVMKLNEKLEDAERLQQLKNYECKTLTDSFTTSSLPNAEARAQINNLLSQLEEEKKKNEKLTQDLEKERFNSLIVSQNKSTAEELSLCLNKLEEMSVSLEKQTERFNSFNSWICLAEKNVNRPAGTSEKKVDFENVPDINKLKSQLSQEKNSSQQNQISLEKLKSQYSSLLNESKGVQEKMNQLEAANENIKKFEEKINNLLEELKQKNQELEDSKNECSNLKEEIKNLNSKNSEISALQLQAELYKNDFQEEREAREKIAGEKEEMAERIRFLQSAIQKINNKNKDSETSESPKNAPENSKPTRYVCPKCMFSFSNLKMCEDHVEDCINSFFYP